MELTTTRWLSYIGVTISVGVFVVALFNDGFYLDLDEPRAWAPGWAELLFGWMSASLAWLANPCLFIAWVFALRRQTFIAAGLALFATGLALSFLLVDEMIVNEGGGTAKITGYGLGYWLWLASAVTMLVLQSAAFVRGEFEARPHPNVHEPVN
jgi:hypothetical protein